jgi:hypothetical protein
MGEVRKVVKIAALVIANTKNLNIGALNAVEILFANIKK